MGRFVNAVLAPGLVVVLCALSASAYGQSGQVPGGTVMGRAYGDQLGTPKGLPMAGFTGAVATTAELKTRQGAAGSVAERAGFSAPGDGGAARYVWSTEKCTAADNGAQVQPVGTGCWIADFAGTRPTPLIWGAKCDGTTNDSAAFTAAGASFGNKGGDIFIPATGAACVLGTGITLPRNVGLRGVGVHNWSATNDTVATMTSAGSWIRCSDTTNPCITINNVGNSIRDLNFIYNQPDPAPGWVPTTYPYTIAVNGSQNFTTLENLTITGATHCLLLEGPASGVANIYTTLRNINFNGCYKIGTRFYRVDNTLYMSNLRYSLYWNLANANYGDVRAYYQANAVGWDVQYLANPQVDGVEFWQNYQAIQVRNGTVTSGFSNLSLGLNEGQLSNISFNQVCQAIALPDGNGTIINASFSNVILYGDTGTNCFAGKTQLDLASDQARVAIDNLTVGYVDTVAAIGRGGGGALRIGGLDVQRYGALTAGSNAFKVSANAALMIDGTSYRSIRPNAGAGKMIGPGVDGTQGYEGPVQIGGCGTIGTPGQGCVRIRGSEDAANTGFMEFFSPSGTRHGYIGRNSTGLTITADDGFLSLYGPDNAFLAVTRSGSKTRVGIGLGGLPPSCAGLTTGDLWMDATAAFTVKVCP